jgi:hypothetical protein
MFTQYLQTKQQQIKRVPDVVNIGFLFHRPEAVLIIM